MDIILGSTSEDKYKILVGCLNNLKIKYSKIIQKSVSSDISEQPLSKAETITGAINRAKNAFNIAKDKQNLISIGLEGGLEINSKLHSLVCIAAIYDGHKTYIGASKLIPLPLEVSDHIHNGHEFGIKIREYAQNCGSTKYENEKIEDLITRKKSFTQAIEKSLKLFIKGQQ